MYETHFGISGPPFQLVPDPSFYFDSAGHHDALAALRRGMSAGTGFIVVSGEIGAGKTTLVRTLLAELESSSLSVAHILSTQLDAVELMQAALIAFGIEEADAASADLDALKRGLLDALLDRGHRAVLIVDEAQNLPKDALDALVAIAEAGLRERAPLQICLVGQPELRAIIDSADLAPLRALVRVSCHLEPLDPSETGAYILHRLRKVGWSGAPSFEGGAFEEIHRWTHGIPRRVNLLCNRLMLSSFLSAQVRIDAEVVRQIAQDLYTEIGEPGAAPLPAAVPWQAPAPPQADAARASVQPSAPSVPRDTAPASLPGVPQRVEPNALLCVVGGQADHIKVAALLHVLAARNDLPAVLMVRAQANGSFQRSRELFAGIDLDSRVLQLGVDSGTPEVRASVLMQRFESLVDRCQPAAVAIFGGSDAVLTCGLVARRKGVRVAYVGAGFRARQQSSAINLMGEPTDRAGDLYFTSDAAADEVLAREGVPGKRIRCVGSLLMDSLQIAMRAALAPAGPHGRLGVAPEFRANRHGYGLVVLERSGNVRDRQGLSEITAILCDVSRTLPLVWTMRPRVRNQLAKFHLDAVIAVERIACVSMQDYVAYVELLSNATCVLTDSWNVQEEATALAIPCLTLGIDPESPITSAVGSNVMVGRNKALATRAVWECVFNGGKRGRRPDLWDGQSARRVADHLAAWLPTAKGNQPAQE